MSTRPMPLLAKAHPTAAIEVGTTIPRTARETPARKTRKAKRGRPSKYGPQTLRRTRAYLDQWRCGPVSAGVPTVIGLALRLGVSRGTLHAWARDETKERFGDLMDELLCRQEMLLIELGLTGRIPAWIATLMLAKHGYVPLRAHVVTGRDGQPIEVAAVTAEMDPAEASRSYRALMHPDAK